VLEAVKLPARVTGLDTGLAKMDGKALSHVEVEKRLENFLEISVCSRIAERNNDQETESR
jgi:hypothetical protein